MDILTEYWGILLGAMFEQGDFNGDGMIDGADAGLLSGNYNTNLQDIWILADLDGDYDVDLDDFDILVTSIIEGTTVGDLNGDGVADGADGGLFTAQFEIEITLAF